MGYVDELDNLRKVKDTLIKQQIILKDALESTNRTIKTLRIENFSLNNFTREQGERITELEGIIEKLREEETAKQNNSLVTDDTAAIVEAYECLATAYGIAETLAKLYAVREAGKPVELTASEIAYKIDTAIKLLKDEE